MYQSRPLDETQFRPEDEVRSSILNSRPHCGGTIQWSMLLECLREASGPITVDNVAIDGADFSRLEKIDVVFRRCLFLGSVTSRNALSRGALTFLDCRFISTVDFVATGLAAITLMGSEFCDRCTLRFGSTLTIERCLFAGDFNLLYEFEEFIEDTLRFRKCEFRGSSRIEVNKPLKELVFDNCQFPQSSAVYVNLAAPITDRIDFGGTAILGLLFIVGPLTGESTPTLSFVGAYIAGQADVRGVNSNECDFRNAALVEGGVEMRTDQLHLTEQRLLEEGRFQDKEARTQSLESISRQFEMLSRAFPRLPLTTNQEDLCLFQKRHYSCQAQVTATGGEVCTISNAVAIGLVSLLGVSTALWTNPLWPLTFLSLLGLIGVAIWTQPKWMGPWPRGFSLSWERFVLRGMLGYGIRIRYVLFSSAAWIVAFGVIYLSSSLSARHGDYRDNGDIRMGGSNFASVIQKQIESSNPTLPPNSCRVWMRAAPFLIRDSLYYSVITFTTVGDNDFVPTGRLRAVTAFESLVGAAMIALVTVIFARKFLRM